MILTPINRVEVQNFTMGRMVNGTQIEATILPNCVASSIEEGWVASKVAAITAGISATRRHNEIL